jgi:hypothetical protein
MLDYLFYFALFMIAGIFITAILMDYKAQHTLPKSLVKLGAKNEKRQSFIA